MGAFASLFGEVMGAAMDSGMEMVEEPPTFEMSVMKNGRPVRSWHQEGEAGEGQMGQMHFAWSAKQALGEPVDDLGR